MHICAVSEMYSFRLSVTIMCGFRSDEKNGSPQILCERDFLNGVRLLYLYGIPGTNRKMILDLLDGT